MAPSVTLCPALGMPAAHPPSTLNTFLLPALPYVPDPCIGQTRPTQTYSFQGCGAPWKGHHNSLHQPISSRLVPNILYSIFHHTTLFGQCNGLVPAEHALEVAPLEFCISAAAWMSREKWNRNGLVYAVKKGVQPLANATFFNIVHFLVIFHCSGCV